MAQRDRNVARTPASPASAAEFKRQAVSVMEPLQQRTAAVIAELGDDICRPTDLCRVLDLNSALGWSIFRLATAPDALSAALYVPTPATMQRFLNAAGDNGVSGAATAQARTAFEAFEVLVERHAGDRNTFASMVRAVLGEESSSEEIKHRRAAFRAQRHILGVHADVMLHMNILGPLQADNTLSQISVIGWLGVQRTRLVSGVLSRYGSLIQDGVDAQGRPMGLRNIEDDAKPGASLLQWFCSKKLPELRTYTEDGFLMTDAFSNEIGLDNAYTYFFGSIRHGIEIFSRDMSNIGPTRQYHTMPLEVFYFDIWVHQSVPITGPPEIQQYFRRSGRDVRAQDFKDDILLTSERFELMGRGPKASRTADIPRYEELAAYVTQARGWRIEEFQLYRCRLRYPVLGSILDILTPFDRGTEK